VLRDGDQLRCADGSLVQVRAAAETLSGVQTDDPLLLARAAYHLGNRHVPLQIAATGLRYRHDHVLDDMVRALGLPVTTLRAPFQPDPGAYTHGHGHGHGREHEHERGHGHEHEHDPHDHD
jgi:urease accessory protein